MLCSTLKYHRYKGGRARVVCLWAEENMPACGVRPGVDVWFRGAGLGGVTITAGAVRALSLAESTEGPFTPCNNLGVVVCLDV